MLPTLPRRLRAVTALLLVPALAATACAGRYRQPVGAGGEAPAGGSVFVSGSSTVEPISAANAEKFRERTPDVAVKVEGPGTGDGFEIFCNGGSDISDASRPIKREELERCRANGVEFVELKVAIDGLAAITSSRNRVVRCVSFADLYALVGPESTRFRRWSDANGLAEELRAAFGDRYGRINAPYPDVPLRVTAPGEESGTFDSFVEIVIDKPAKERGQKTETRPDYQASPNDNVIMEGISGSATSLGWVGFAFVQKNPGPIRALEVDGGEGCVAPTPETIAAGRFPIARPLYIYVNRAKAEANPAVAAYVDFYLSDEGLASVGELGYVNLEPAEVEATRTAWSERRVGPVDGGE